MSVASAAAFPSSGALKPAPAVVRRRAGGASSPAMPVPVWILCAYLFLVTVFGKGPTYLGIPPLFIGEMTLIVSVLWMVNRHGLKAALIGNESALACLIAAYMALGAVLTLPGIAAHGVDAVRDAAIWYYCIFFFIGHALGADAALGTRAWRFMVIAWGFALIWGSVDQLCQLTMNWTLATLGPVLPWRGEPLFFNSNYEQIQHIGLAALIALHPRISQGHLGRWRVPLAVLSVVPGLVLVSIAHGRGVKVGLALGALILAILHFAPGKPLQISRRTIAGFVILILLMGGGVLVFGDDFMRVSRLERFTEANPSSPSGTAYWRMIWWRVLWQEVNDQNPAFGLGFGQSLSMYNPYLQGAEHDYTAWPVRSPHNFNITVFSRMGFVGLALWLAVFVTGIGGLFLRTWRGEGAAAHPERREELAFWIVMLVATWGNGSFGVLMEGPVLGIWFWFALGFSRGRSEPSAAVESKWEMA